MISDEKLDEILLEWSYRLEDGTPNMKDPNKVLVLNEVLRDMGYAQYKEQISETLIPEVTFNELGNKTSAQEGMVCLFYDAICTDPKIIDAYSSIKPINKKSDKLESELKELKTNVAKIVKVLKSVKPGNRYGTGASNVNVPKMISYIEEVLLEPYKLVGNDNFRLVNNQFSAANTIYKESKIPSQVKKPGLVNRGDIFEKIRKHAVDLAKSVHGIADFAYPDNWCPGDIYLMNESDGTAAASAKSININGRGNDKSLNSYFHGSDNKGGKIVAVSLKMEEARAGKATTFLKNVVVKNTDKLHIHGKTDLTELANKFIVARRRIKKYYADSSFVTQIPTKINTSIADILLAADKLNIKANAPFAKELSTLFPKQKSTYIKARAEKGNKIPAKKIEDEFDIKEDKIFILTKYQPIIYKELQKVVDDVYTKLNSKDKLPEYKQKFVESHDKFLAYIESLGIKGVNSNIKEVLKDISDMARENQVNVLNKKAGAYDLASELIDTWVFENKQITEPFKSLAGIENPFIALTLFAIAQHGLNPDFYKVIGDDRNSIGSCTEFKANAVVDAKTSTEDMEIVDSPNKAGFQLRYMLTLNGHKYRTTLEFIYSNTTIKIEVTRLDLAK